MNIKEKFIELTSNTYPYGYEEELLHFLPKGYEIDEDGNYRFEVGSGSKTIFTCHLDTASKDYKRIEHVFDGKYIRTNKKTILGADDKAGMTILLYMIENEVPGLYYFFIGEEVGCIGSTAASKRVEFFSKYNKMISFDRRGTTSIITHQSSKRTCSDSFADSLSKEYNKLKMKLKKDDTGVYTDSAEFTSIIPECTNISVGYYNEHTHDEHQDIEFLERLAKASVLIDWESLSIKRDPNKTEWKSYGYDNYSGFNHWNGYSEDYYPKRGRSRGKKKNKNKNRNSHNSYNNYNNNKAFSDEDFYGSRYKEKSQTFYSHGGKRIYFNDLDNDITDSHEIYNSKNNVIDTHYLTIDELSCINSKSDYYKAIKNVILDDKLSYREFKIIKEQCLNMSDEDDLNFAKEMELSFVSVDNV